MDFVNARGSLGVYIWRRSARQAERESVVERLESVCMERLEFVGAVRVGVESESCGVIGVGLELRAVGVELLRTW